MDRKLKWALTGLIVLLINAVAFSQQLKLGKNPYIIEKSAVLELQSDNQGLLFPRIADTNRISAMKPPDGMVVFHIPSLQLLLRTGGYWKPLTVSSALNNFWSTTGNASTAYPANFLGTTDFHSLYFRTNNIQRLVVDSLGNVGVGTVPSFAATPFREKFLVDAGVTTSVNAIVGKGNIDSYLQLNIQNLSTGTFASSDIVATANNGSETTNFVNLGINGQNYSNGVMGAGNDAYLYNIGQNFLIANGSASKSLIFMTGGTSQASNERMRIDGNGKIGIGITAPTAFLHLMAGTTAANTAPLKFSSGPLMAVPETGAVEYLTDKFYGTIATLSARKEFTLNDIGLTSGRVPFTTTDGRLTDLGTFTYAANRLSPTYLTLAAGTATAGTAPLVMSVGTKLVVPVAGSIEFDGTHFYGTVGSTRYPFDQQAGTTYTGSNGIALVGNDFRNTLFTGIAGDQTVRGGNAAGNSLILSSTIHATKGKIAFGTSAYNEVNNRLGVGNVIPTEVLDVTGNVKFSGALMPNNNAGTAGYFLTSTGALTAPTWNAFDTTSITGFSQKVRSLFTSTAPITYLNGLIGITKATGSANGYLSSDDWNTFNNKAGSFTSGNLTETGSSVLTIAGGVNAVLGSGTTLQVKQASASQNGFLSSDDWIAFNTKLSTIDTNAISNFYLKVRGEFSAGTGISYNASTGVISSSINTGNFWSLGGNAVTTSKTFGTTDNNDLPFITNNAEGMRLTSTGNLGIGTTNPSNKLSILGTNPLFLSGVQTGSVADSLLTISGGIVKKLSLSALSALAVSSVGLSLPSIFNVSGSPVTSTGVLTGTLVTQQANRFFAGPAAGINAVPAFRAIGPADLPVATSSLLGGISVGAGLSVTPLGVLSATNTTDGTVTTVSATGTQGVTASVINATTTPAITIGLGAITPTSVAATGSVTGSNLSGSNTGDQTISLTADVTGSGTGSFATTISPNVVSYSKMQQVTGSTLLGNPTGLTANASEITLGSGFSFAGSTLNYTPGTSGTVSSVGLALPDIFSVTVSPITTTGSLTAVLATQAANKIFAGPPTGVATAPTFRTLVPADLPIATTTLLGGVSVGAGLSVTPTGVLSTNFNMTSLSATAPLSYVNTTGVLSLAKATGSVNGYLASTDWTIFNNKVSSVSITGSPVFATTVLPVTAGAASGTLTLNAQAKNVFFSGPATGVNAAPTFRALAAADLPLATTTTVGGVAVGAGLSVTAGVLSATNTNGGTVTTVSATGTQGVSASVVNATTTPAITIGLGDITPISVAATGSITGSNLSGTNTGDQTISLTSDVTGTGTGSFVTTISPNVVSYSKMQQVTASSILGNPSGSTSNASEITLGSGFSFSGSTLNYTPGTSGTVSSVGLTLPDIFSVTVSPITTTGSLTAVLATQAANKIFAGPVTGINAVPAFRSMVAADLPFATASAVGGVSVGAGLSVTPTGVLSTNFNMTSLSATAPLSYVNTTGVLSLAKATGSINGYLASTDWTIFNNKVSSVSINGSPIFATTVLGVTAGAASGTLTLNTQAKNLFLSGPSTGVNAAPTFRAMVPADLPLATTTTVGGVSVGAGLSVTAGVLSATNTNGGTVTTVSATGTQGVSASVVNATTTPAITIGLGDITPLSIATTGSVTGSNLSGTNTGDQTISLTSDVTGTGSGSFATTISPNVVSYAKMQQVTASRLLGNPAGLPANASEITLGSGFSFSGSTLNFTPGTSGTVTSVGLSLPVSVFNASSPVTTNGSLTSTFVAQTANRFFAGPATGVNAVPGFRALVAADLPVATASTIGGVSVGAGLSVTAGVLSATNTAMGTVTSVGLNLPVSIFGASAAVTTSGSLTSALITQPANSIFAGPASGSSAAVPTFRNLVPSDLPVATASTLGVVSIGSGLNIDVAGILTTSVNSGNVWSQAGNTVTSIKKLGTIDNYDLPFVTNNTEKMRLTSAGYLGIGTSYPATALHVSGMNPLTLTGVQIGATTDSILTIMSGTVKKLAFSSVTNGSSWSPTGNTGTNSVTNFLGTIDTRSLSFRTNNIQRMFIDSLTGNIGIGTSTPASDLTVFQKAGTTGSKGIRFAGTPISGTNAGSGFSMTLGYNQINNKQLWLGDADYLGNSGGTFFRFSASGGYTIIDAINGDNTIRKAIGIGVANDVNSGVILGSDNNAASPTSFVWANGNMAIGAGYRANGAPLNGLIVQGNVGIGTSTPSATLDIVGSLEMNGPFRPAGDGGIAGYFLQSTGTTTAPVWFNADNLITTQAWGLGGNANINSGNFLGTTNAVPMAFRTKNTERIRIDTLGRVGIGTITPSQRLDVDGNLNVRGSVYVDGDATNAGSVSPGLILGGASSGESISSKRTATPNQYGIDFYTASNLRMTIYNGGSVGIGTGTATPLDKLTVAGSIGPALNGAYNLGNTTNRWSQIYATNGTIQTSDRREKTNIADLRYGLKEILALRPVSYNWKKSPDSDKMLGLIAQEVKEIVPEVVIGNESKEMLGLKYADMIPVLINAIKEQQKQIDDLKQQIKLLQK